ncbi:hypothetical protein DM01DRAFT_52726 [Hesseltinella vesiculosa]|uniref:Peptidase A1 domain-containing protein n=1 Tax=Hesseltinella vesiculosa TaxID=101127 RepID=A0A1X2GUR9_9FUNG|nr:hypothetical protein DM01DRAFT_52726 [Hesseltinella vesiculosa]
MVLNLLVLLLFSQVCYSSSIPSLDGVVGSVLQACALNMSENAIICQGGSSTTRANSFGDDFFNDLYSIFTLDLTQINFTGNIYPFKWTRNKFAYSNSQHLLIPINNGSAMIMYGGSESVNDQIGYVTTNNASLTITANINPPNYTAAGNRTFYV